MSLAKEVKKKTKFWKRRTNYWFLMSSSSPGCLRTSDENSDFGLFWCYFESRLDASTYVYFTAFIRTYNRPWLCGGRYAVELTRFRVWAYIVLFHHPCSFPLCCITSKILQPTHPSILSAVYLVFPPLSWWPFFGYLLAFVPSASYVSRLFWPFNLYLVTLLFFE